MKLPLISVNKDLDVAHREAIEWLKHGITIIRTDTMQEAIDKLSKEPFLLVSINADTVNYIPLLKIMSTISHTPIIIASSDYSKPEHTRAILLGADGYVPFDVDSRVNVEASLALLGQIDKRNNKPILKTRIITCGNLTVFYEYHQIFCNDIEIILTQKEFRIFYYLLVNRNTTLPFHKISSNVWGAEAVTNNAMWQVILRLRKKLDDANFKGGEIINFRGVGYRLSVPLDK